MLVRRRTEDDLDQCIGLAAAVQARDGYPVHLDTDLRSFLVTDDARATWVAEHDGHIAGHVALHRHTLPAVLAIASEALRRPVDQLGVVARLLVDPDGRQRGTGRALLEAATREARTLGLWPILDVCDRFGPAIALYERNGWVRGGQVSLRLDGREIVELVYLYAGPDD